uniref:Ycf1 n=1 Tax=Notoscyphus lutescens TaxID=399523 RepID=A0A8F2XW07_9MARC|nr:Ycf1 [Notoscyphus lutescens]
MISISQAYVLRKIWGMKTNDKSYLKSLLKSWTFHLFIKNNFRIFLREQGLLSYLELSNFKQDNWNGWIEHFDRYNLSPKVWYSIAPKKWRSKVSNHWKKNSALNLNIESEKKSIFFEQTNNNSSLFLPNSLVKGVEKSNKLSKINLLTYNFCNLNKNSIVNNFLRSNGGSRQNNIIMNGIRKYSFIFHKNRVFTDFAIDDKKNLFLDYNLLLWFVPEFIERRNEYKYIEILNLDILKIMKQKNSEIFRDKELFREREINQSIRQWRWKSRNYEKRFGELGNMASLMTFMQNQETRISLSGKMRKDLEFFRLFFRRNNNFNQLAINSEHRLPRLLDDQILIYKLVTTLSSFKQRVKRISNLRNIDEHYFDINTFWKKEREAHLSNSLNLEDILLPKRRRELRILNSLTFQREIGINLTENLLNKIQERKRKIMIDKNKIIKRFIWSGYRFEDLACMNRFWFSTMNGSRFSMLRFRMYPIIY